MSLPALVEPAPLEPLPQPEIEVSAGDLHQTVASFEMVLPPPPVIKPEPKRSRRTVPSAAGKPELEIVEEGAPELPQLGEVLSERQLREYLHVTEASLESAKRIAASLHRRPLDPRQADALGQVQDFIRQAEAAQKKDLPLARKLAYRAEVLAKDLLSSLN